MKSIPSQNRRFLFFLPTLSLPKHKNPVGIALFVKKIKEILEKFQVSPHKFTLLVRILPKVKRAIHFKNKLADILFIYNIKRMAKKPQAEKQSKKKQSKNEDEAAVVDQPKTQKRKGKESSKTQTSDSLELFPLSLQGKYQDFGNLFSEINRSIQGSGKNDLFDLGSKKSQLSERIQEACKQVFKDEVKSAEDWIEETQASILAQIENLEQSYDKIRVILEETKSFKAEQIISTLSVLQNKVDNKRTELQKYKELLQKSRSVYN